MVFLSEAEVLDQYGARLRAAGLLSRNGGPHQVLTRTRQALSAGLTFDQTVEWWDFVERKGPLFALRAIEARLPLAHVRRWDRTALGVGADVLGDEYLRERFAILRVALDQQWHPQAFDAVAATSPTNIAPADWMQVWTRFMPAVSAGLYAAAGIGFEDAVRFHLTGESPEPAALRVLAGLRGVAVDELPDPSPVVEMAGDRR